MYWGCVGFGDGRFRKSPLQKNLRTSFLGGCFQVEWSIKGKTHLAMKDRGAFGSSSDHRRKGDLKRPRKMGGGGGEGGLKRGMTREGGGNVLGGTKIKKKQGGSQERGGQKTTVGGKKKRGGEKRQNRKTKKKPKQKNHKKNKVHSTCQKMGGGSVWTPPTINTPPGKKGTARRKNPQRSLERMTLEGTETGNKGWE